MEKPHNDNFHLNLYRNLIEEQLGWGSSDSWENQDFLALSEKILETTGVQLSGSTLKRIWGKVKYQSTPNTSTLNTLAHFLKYENWLSFKAAHPIENNDQVEDFPGKTQSRKTILLKALAFGGIILVAVSIISFIYRGNSPKLSTDDLEKTIFSSYPVTSGIPNTVVFKYDVSHFNGSDFMIQQYWDIAKRFNIDKSLHEATSIYYYPGFWRAKLLVDGQVIKQHDLHIKSEGWMATIEHEPEPRYLLEGEFLKDKKLTISDKVAAEINANPEAPEWLSYHNVRKFGGLDGDNFIYETMVKNSYEKGDGVCKHTQLLLLGSKSAVVIPLAALGCSSEFGLMFSNFYESGKTRDLSAFGVDFSKWQKVRLEVENKQVKIYKNDQLIQELVYEESIGEIAGLRFKFRGTGDVKYVKLWNQNNELVFDEPFITQN